MEVVGVIVDGDPSTRALCGSGNPSPVGLRDWPIASPTLRRAAAVSANWPPVMNSARLLRTAATRARPYAVFPRRRALLNILGHRNASTESHERPATAATAAKSAAQPKEVRLTAES